MPLLLEQMQTCLQPPGPFVVSPVRGVCFLRESATALTGFTTNRLALVFVIGFGFRLRVRNKMLRRWIMKPRMEGMRNDERISAT